MARERTVVRGIVLRATDTGEADRILTVLTAEKGRLTVVAKGARGRRSRVTACTDLLVYAELTLSESRGWQYLTEGNTLELFDGVRRDVELLALGCYFAELTEAVCCGGEEDGAFLPLLLNALYALGTLRRPQALVKAAFETRLCALAGFAPLLDGCAVCGRSEPKEPVLDLRDGVLRCAACGIRETGAALTPAALAAMRYVLRCNEKKLYSFDVTGGDLTCFARAAEGFAEARLERRFATLEFYRGLTA